MLRFEASRQWAWRRTLAFFTLHAAGFGHSVSVPFLLRPSIQQSLGSGDGDFSEVTSLARELK